jgi:hypothetical protein
MNYSTKILTAALVLCLAGCRSESRTDDNSFWSQCDVVATRKIVDGDTVVVLDAEKLSRTRSVPLDLIVENYEVIKFDSSTDDALIGKRVTNAFFSENYIGVSCFNYFPLKLFRKDGTFVRHIGGFGQGPNEYLVIDDVQMDEKKNRIYVLTYDASRVLVYDFEGNGYPPIKLYAKTFYGSKIVVNAEEKRVTVTKTITPRNEDYVVWIQDFDGNLIQGIEHQRYYPESEVRESSQSTCTCLHGDCIDLFQLIQHNTGHYLYHYDTEKNRLAPRFTTTGLDDVFYYVFVYELPRHYVVEEAKSTASSEEPVSRKIIVDKATLRGCRFDGFITQEGIVLDHYDLLWTNTRGHFHLVDYGSVIAEKIKKTVRESLTDEQRAKLAHLEALIANEDEDEDCSLLFRGTFIK